jgi:hypothetical protein
MASKQSVLRLYRDVLRAAQRFPSKKRVSIIADIKLEWREARRAAAPATTTNLSCCLMRTPSRAGRGRDGQR